MKEEAAVKILRRGGAALLLLFSLIPFLWMIVISFAENPELLITGEGSGFSLRSYGEVLEGESFRLTRYLINSLIVSLTAAGGATLAASLSAYAISRMKFPGRLLIPVLLLGFSMIPQISIVGYLFEMFAAWGLINTYPALIMPYMTLAVPLALWIMLSYFNQLPRQLDEAAMMDGAGRWQIFRSIIIPMSLPGAAATFIIAFIYSFNEFLFALMLTTDYKVRTVTVGIALFEGLYGQVPWGQIMAAAVISVLPVAGVLLFFQKYIVYGLTRGGVKE